ncbi:LOT5 [[Candida] subhashii]|uniref:Protein LOT5 n=1 Tax=[Candida] subhashii TaxID=561895 RepID=A0A8J5UU50_9ASCO|nr:LOT5 [[Candida] subhashii]KAG7661400.1 LOT5 [[Candida] subhashii]
MSPKSRIVYEKPNVENTLPFKIYQTTSPEKFSLEDDDKFVIYSGGPNYQISKSDNAEVEFNWDQNVSLFVLNTTIIIWFNLLKFGWEIPYTSIILSGVKGDKLFLQIVCDDIVKSAFIHEDYIASVDLEISISEDDRISERNGGSELFKYVEGDIGSLYEGIAKCSALQYDSEQDMEEQQEIAEGQGFFWGNSTNGHEQQLPALEIPSDWTVQEPRNKSIVEIPNVGDADDLDDIELHDDEEEIESTEALPGTNGINEAGMYVDVGYASIAGAIRKREEEGQEAIKSRRLR